MQLTQAERKMISLESSYRVQRNCCTMISVFCVLPLLFAIGVALVSFLRSPGHIEIIIRVILQTDWGSLAPMLNILLVFCFLAYRAQAKLTLIAHLKHHAGTERSEPVVPANG